MCSVWRLNSRHGLRAPMLSDPVAPLVVEIIASGLAALAVSSLVGLFLSRRFRSAERMTFADRSFAIDHYTATSAEVRKLKDELADARREMEQRRVTLISQEEIIAAQARELAEAKKLLAQHEITIHSMAHWCGWVTETLETQGVTVPDQMLRVINSLDEFMQAGNGA